MLFYQKQSTAEAVWGIAPQRLPGSVLFYIIYTCFLRFSEILALQMKLHFFASPNRS